MKRKRVTEQFPWLLPLRKRQRVFCFYTKMALDRKRYAKSVDKRPLPFVLFSSSSPLYNKDTGFDMKYQYNKVFNLKLAARKLDGLVINPGETFSFWKALRHADRETPYREGLNLVNGVLTTTPGGGLCQMSNLLFALFLHSPLRIIERTGHRRKEFPDPGTSLAGCDATVSEGWIDLKVENREAAAFQIKIAFDEERIYGVLRTDSWQGVEYQLENRAVTYEKKDSRIYQRAELYRTARYKDKNVCDREENLYENWCEIAYPLPDDVEVKEEEET